MESFFDDFINRFSVDNLLKQAQEPKTPALTLPAEYMQDKPDLLGMNVDKYLNAQQSPVARQPLMGGDKSNAALSPWTPKPTGRYANTPRVGKDLSLGDITNWIKARESTNNYTALNREQKGNTASGAYQYTDRTWNGYGGYAKALLAPKHVQDRRFQEDIAARYKRYGGDPFKMIAEHYLPAAASDPRAWNKPYKLPNGKVVKPVASYVAYVTKGTPLEAAFHDYMARQQ